MCVTASVAQHLPLDSQKLPADLAWRPAVRILFVQEAILYLLARETVRIVVTALIETPSCSPVDVWFTHEGAVLAEDLRATLSSPGRDPLTAAIAAFQAAAGCGPPRLGIGIPSDPPFQLLPDEVAFRTLPLTASGKRPDPAAPFTCVGFGPIAASCEGTAPVYALRIGLSIQRECFHRFVHRIDSTHQYFFGIDGPSVVLDDIRYSHLPRAPHRVRVPYTEIFNSILYKCHSPISCYEVLTFDADNGEAGIRYDRCIAEAEPLVVKQPFDAGPLGPVTVNVWRSRTERFVILRGSILGD